MSPFHFSTWPTPYFKYWPQYSFRAAKWFVIRRVVWNYFPKPKMPPKKKKLWGKHPDYNLFWQGNRLEPNFLRLHKIASFSDQTVVSPNPHLMKKFLPGQFNLVLLVCFSSESLFGKIGPNSNSKWPHENHFFSCNRPVWLTYCRKLPKVAMNFPKRTILRKRRW